MKYEFHVGDYVETVGGFVGWIYRTRDDGYIWVTNKDVASCSYHIPEELKCFNRIGQYDFTKKDTGKIEPLTCETASDYSNEKLRKKINELVEAVNELKTDYKKHLQTHELTER